MIKDATAGVGGETIVEEPEEEAQVTTEEQVTVVSGMCRSGIQ